MTTKQDNMGRGGNRNPEGKGGFRDNPQNRSDGGWKKEDSIGYQYRMLQRLTIEELEKWIDEHPKNIRTVAQDLAYKALIKAQKELPYLKEVTDRSEGKAPQSIDMTTNGETIKGATIEFANPDQTEDQSSAIS
jgi:hypothetical protein